MMDIIRIENLYKSYGDVKAVQDLSFKVKQGELFAFLGVNGAGKSTTISIICGTLEKDGGNVFVDGVDLDHSTDDVKRSIGVVFQNSVLDKSLSAYDNLKHRASLYGITSEEFETRLDELTDILQFKDLVKRPINKLSGGQKRKVDIARALLHKPKILILDEPTTGLDPQTRITMWSVIEDLRKKENMTVFLTTHYMEEAAEADYVVIIDAGKIVAEGTPHDLKDKYAKDVLNVYGVSEQQIERINLPFEKIAGGFRLNIENTAQATKIINTYSELFNDFEVVKGKMDTVFLNVTGKNLLGDNK